MCYRPPNSCKENDDAMYSLLNRASAENLVVLGDFNFPEIKWNKVEYTTDVHPFIECIQDNFLEQMVNKPTRGENFLDLILCSDSSFVHNIYVGEPFETSDHQTVKFDLVLAIDEIRKTKESYNYFKADYDQIRDYVKSRNWDKMGENCGIEEFWVYLKTELLELRDKFVPQHNVKKSKCKWVTQAVEKSRRAKKKAWDRYVRSGRNCLLYSVYINKLRESVKAVSKAKQDFELKLAGNIKNDSKSFYAYIRSKQRSCDKAGPLRDSNGDVVNDEKLMADLFNNYFISVFTKEELSNIPIPVNIFNDNILNGLDKIVVDEMLVLRKLSELNVSKSIGARLYTS